MKKSYEAPLTEVVKFEYKDQVVAASGGCKQKFVHEPTPCQDSYPVWQNNQA